MVEAESALSPQPSSLAEFGRRASQVMPALAFFGGFLWDAITLGQSVGGFDLGILFVYLVGAAFFMWVLARNKALQSQSESPVTSTEPQAMASRLSPKIAQARQWWFEKGCNFALQFCFGGLFSALFIFYFKSSSQLTAYLVTLGLGGLLIANEFLDRRYDRFILTLSFFALCCMLFFNFALPHALGSLHAAWFYVSLALGLGCAYLLHRVCQGRPRDLWPVVLLSGLLITANALDFIPPVPLVKKELAVGTDLQRVEGLYQITLEKAPWYAFWREQNATVHLVPGTRLYCLSSVFAPEGMQTQLFHRWSRRDEKQGWVTASRIGFSVNGGRKQGYRGYTYKQNLQDGKWRVAVETADGRTIAYHTFTLQMTAAPEKDRIEFWGL